MPDGHWAARLVERLEGKLSEPPRQQEPLDVYTTWGVGGPAALLIYVNNSEELLSVASELTAIDKTFLVLGCGSNLLISDDGFDGAVIKLAGEFKEFTVDGNTITAAAAVTLPTLSKAAAEHSLTGLEFCRGIPGTLGGGLRMNAGANGADLSGVVASVSWLEFPSRPEHGSAVGDPVVMHGLPGFSYRSTSIPDNSIVLKAKLELESCEADEIRARMDEMQAARRSHQPRGRSAGSVFKNPPGESAGRLIEQAGLKTAARGGASVSAVHANFIVNDGRATADDILSLMKLIRDEVLARSGVLLLPEVKLIGFPEDALDRAVT